ncbi:MAG TPA: DUF6371 domain-containing protein [Pyrinomonadaceae bacterium]|jgi:hypothetical protein|nr:DUF6371 domain-containing protein [Pyrinomonadaceae bacterium]
MNVRNVRNVSPKIHRLLFLTFLTFAEKVFSQMRYRFTLEKYNGRRTRHTCPNCGKPGEFTRYIDTQTGNYLADYVGRCNREVNCGYQYTPKKYFSDHRIAYKGNDPQHQRVVKPPERSQKPINTIPFEPFRESLTNYTENNFICYLKRLFGADITCELIKRFYIGSSNYWSGSTVFWQIDGKRRIRSGKIMLYDSETGRRVKEVRPDGSKQSKITWAHSILQKQGAIQGFNLRQCLFGEHQLAAQPKNKPVAVVEAEKTAIIATPYLPDFVWLACGSLTNLTADKCRVLTGRKVVLFPDLNCFKKWSDRAKHLQALLDCSIAVSDLLERKTREEDKLQGFDLADYLVKYQLRDNKPPDEIYIPASVPNTIEAIMHCIEMQAKRGSDGPRREAPSFVPNSTEGMIDRIT